jgi:hypothetical protein
MRRNLIPSFVMVSKGQHHAKDRVYDFDPVAWNIREDRPRSISPKCKENTP